MTKYRPDVDQKRARERKTFKKAGELAAQHGFKWFLGDWPFHSKEKGCAADCTEELMHELAHYLVSPPEYRNWPHFGLGHPSGSLRARTQVVPNDLADELEEQASILGIVLCRECGCLYDLCVYIACEHSWDEEGNNQEERIEQLQEKGLWGPERQRIWNKIYKAL